MRRAFLLAAGLLCGAATVEAADYRHVIRKAYDDILQRPADAGGLAHYDALMNATPPLTEAGLREVLLRSVEYADRFPNAPPPPPPPPPSAVTPLRVDGSRFIDDAGVVKLSGMVVCCDDPSTPEVDEALARGWPFIDDSTLELLAAHRQNYTIIRMGPSISRDVFGDGEAPEFVGYALVGALYDLDSWNPAFWSRARDVLSKAAARGIYVNVSIVDSWVLDHRLTPWSAERNLQGYEGGSLDVVRGPPSTVHERWIRKVVAELGAFPNVLFTDGNESFKGRPSQAWVHGIRDIARDELARRGYGARLIATNSGVSDQFDFIVYHDRGLPEPEQLPVVVDEYSTRPCDAILVDSKRGWDWGTVAYIYWRGEHPWAETERCLAGLKVMVEGGDPHPIPATCPTLTKMGVQIHNMVDRHFQPAPRPVVDGHVILDLTPKFGSPPRPCNDEHNTRCGGRPCEDPRGGVWSLVEGPPGTVLRVQTEGFQVKVGPLRPGHHRIRVSPHPDSRDALGARHQIRPDAPQEVAFTVEP